MDITLWECSGRDSRKIRVGQYILLDNLVTSDKNESGNKRVWYVNGSVVLGTKMYNGKRKKKKEKGRKKKERSDNVILVSTLSSLLTSHEFRNIIPLWYSKEMKMDHFQVEGTITGWEFYLKTQAQFVLSSSNTRPNTDIDFMDLSIGDRITTIARKVYTFEKRPIRIHVTQRKIYFRFRLLHSSYKVKSKSMRILRMPNKR